MTVRTLTAEPLSLAAARLGEGPVWLGDVEVLLWVDITEGCIHRFDPVRFVDDRVALDQPIGCIVPRASGGYVAGLRHGIAALDEQFAPLGWLAQPEADQPGNRFNDGACDPWGRLWLGTMASDTTRGRGALYRLDTDLRLSTVLAGVSISNGIGWSPDGHRMYYVDSLRGVDAFEYAASDGQITGRRELVACSDDGPVPDGLTVDDTGCIWIAFYGAGEIRRFTPDGSLDTIVTVPGAPNVTSCAFGGRDLSTLYITTATGPVAPAASSGGDLFALATDAQGLPTSSYGG